LSVDDLYVTEITVTFVKITPLHILNTYQGSVLAMHLQFSDNIHYVRDIGYVSTIL